MNDHQRQTKSWRTYTPCGCLLLMFATCIAMPGIGWIVWSANAARSVEAELAKIRAANEPVEPAELDKFYTLPLGGADATQLWIEAGQALENTSYAEAARGLPIVGQGPEIPPVGEPWEQLEAVEAFLADYKDEMAKIHEAAELGGYARFDQDFEEGCEALLSELQRLRTSARMLQLEARVAAHRGDAAAAARSIHAMFATCRAVQEEPLLVSHLVHVALAGMAVDELGYALGSVEISDADLQMLREDVRSVDFQHSLERSLVGERVLGILTFRNPGRFDVGAGLPLPARANNEDLALYLSTFAKYLEASRQPFPQATELAQEANFDVHQVTGGSPVNNLRYIFTNMLLPTVSAVFEASARGVGAATSAETSLAIEQYRRAKGKLAETLAELVPEFLAAVPMDPTDGQPLRYVINDGGYVLYSGGKNRIDDGGVMGVERLDEVFSVKIRATTHPDEANE
ncbi:MAG: hypothetical protein HYV60_08235 [Planctomycetia bacterium]|nr:hypothetical protein [Planctomycetia bacterium]